MPRYPKAEALSHGEAKQSKQFMLAPTVSAQINFVADALKIRRAEALEQAIRASIWTFLLIGML